MAIQVVLREVIEALGGWEAALFLDSGAVNLDIDVDAWPTEDKVPHRTPDTEDVQV